MTARAEKEARARFGQAWDRTLRHIRVGARQDGTSIGLVGMAGDLHGPAGCCTCCHGRTTPPATAGRVTPDEWATFVAALHHVAVDGEVHQSAMRPLIRGRIHPKHIGQAYARAKREGLIREVRREPSTDVEGRNTNKWEPVYQLAA